MPFKFKPETVKMNWLFVTILVLGLIIYAILTFSDRSKIYQQWNEFLIAQCNYQNETDRAFNNIPSLQSAWVCQNEYVREMHRGIFLLHNELLSKVEEYFKTMIECVEEIPQTYQEESDFHQDDTRQHLPKRETRYFPFKINRMTTGLVETFGLTKLRTSAFNFGLLILEPGAATPWRRSLSKGLYRYHYALKLPKVGGFGLYLRLNDEKDSPIHRIKWKEKHGFIWDATFNHHLANHSMEPCFLLVADIPRHLSWRHHWINTILHTYFPPSESGISVDL